MFLFVFLFVLCRSKFEFSPSIEDRGVVQACAYVLVFDRRTFPNTTLYFLDFTTSLFFCSKMLPLHRVMLIEGAREVVLALCLQTSLVQSTRHSQLSRSLTDPNRKACSRVVCLICGYAICYSHSASSQALPIELLRSTAGS